MWLLPLFIIIIGLLIYLTLSTAYLMFLAAAYFIVREPKSINSKKVNRFAILVPAHNEELLISRLCKSLLEIKYPREFYEIFIIADNCSDRTVEICASFPVNVLQRNDPSHTGKGFAISWGLSQIPLEEFDAVFMVDADNVVDPLILVEVNKSVNRGEQAIQCYNSVGNRHESWFTQLLFVSRTIGNLLYHHAKYKLGLSSYLMGNGICFTSTLLREKGWTAFSTGEDWEYYAQLIEGHIKIGFSKNAKVFHQESRSLNQATSQRLRWSSGRFKVLRNFGLNLFLKGLRNRDWFTLDASLPFIFPNYSLQINLTIITIFLCVLSPASMLKTVTMELSIGLFGFQIVLFVLGGYLAGDYWAVVKAAFWAPFFLVWKAVIDLFSLTGIHRGDRWVRTKRHLSAQGDVINR
jgi:cellulose synthase/poly-beta-1,6-N-acetylglucosamine synthase-like glycosyltransferase